MITVNLRLVVRVILALGLIAVATAPASASLIGISVTGDLNFNGFDGTNFFDPVNGFVPAGAPNSTTPTVTIVDPGPEFEYNDGFAGFTVDFGPESLSSTEFSVGGSGITNGWTMRFTGLGAAGAIIDVQQVSDPSSFPGLTFDFGADRISLAFPGEVPIDTFTARFSITQAVRLPEPGTLELLALALAGLGVAKAAGRRARLVRM